LPRFSVAAVQPAIRRFVIVKILVRLNHAAGFEAEHVQTPGGKRVRGHSARSSRADHDHVVNSLRRQTKFCPSCPLVMLRMRTTRKVRHVIHPLIIQHVDQSDLRSVKTLHRYVLY
jgi:hypothetical protein